jgi:S-adenosylmethionine hydrolase
MSSPAIITLTTDFGHRDPYVGIMKGAILSICPEARIVDLCHEVTPFHTEQAPFLISQAVPHFPEGTIHVAVVDPGVGGPRRALIAKGRRGVYVGPDNGVLGPLLADDAAVTVHRIGTPDFMPQHRSATFHGRDVFAPAAAHLAMGRALSEFGPAVADPPAAPFVEPKATPTGWRGQVVHVDRFGNLITNIPAFLAERIESITVGHHTAYHASHFGGVKSGVAAFIQGSSARIEVFVNEGNASDLLGANVGGPVVVTRKAV